MKPVYLTIIAMLFSANIVTAIQISPIDWKVGVGANLYSAAGNIALDAPGVDGDLSLVRVDSGSSSWQFTFSYFWPNLAEYVPLPTGRTAILYVLRGAPFQLYGHELWLKAGLGIGYFVNKSGNSSTQLGTPCYRADISIPAYSAVGIDLEVGLSYIGSLLPGTQYFSDRLGLGIQLYSHRLQKR